MSPQQFAAHRMAAQGRGPDSQLVHMSPREVAGLQALAMAGGGSLSINPNTGLPEAGFLDKMLPMILGAGAMALTGGAAGAAMPGLFGLGMPATIGLGLGGIEAARTGSLEKGLMAGLGAYGGAGLAGGLMGAGASSVGATANALGTPAATGAGSQAAMLAAQNQGFGQAGLQALGQSAATAPGAASIVSTPMQSITAGAKGLLEPVGRDAFMSNIGGTKGLLTSGLAAAAPALMEQPDFEAPKIDSERYDYAFDPGRVGDPDSDYRGPASGQRRYFNPSFRRRYAEGGPIESMSAANVYDMQNARGGVSDMGIDNSTGMQRMANGGIADLNRYSGNAYAFAPIMQTPRLTPLPIVQPPVGDAAPGGGEDDYSYVYDPVTKTYKKVAKEKPKTGTTGGSTTTDFGGGIGGDMGGSTGGTGIGLDALSDASVGYGEQAAIDAATAGAVGDVASGDVAGLDAGSLGGLGAGDLGGLDAGSLGGLGAGDLGGLDAGSLGGASDSSGGDAGASGDSGGDSGGWADGGLAALASGGASHLGDYSDGGRLLRGPGDGVSDSIPAMIGQRRPARLADGEFVVPARIVSELGNGSTDAGARKLYAMMDRVQRARGKTVGKGKVAKNSRADKFLPA